MLFNSHEFIFLFLPLVLFGFYYLARWNHQWAIAWLGAASLFFYGWWNPAYISLLLSSIIVNYLFGMWIVKANASCLTGRSRKLLIVSLLFNLALLGYYKYTGFFLANLSSLSGTSWNNIEIILPLGISFFTFTQIAFLVDAYQGKAREYRFVHYLLFVTYFPHLIAGPILHHKEMMPQFDRVKAFIKNYEDIAVGLTIFAIGLFKKVVLADGIAVYVEPVFSAPSLGIELSFFDSWGGALAYTLQLYFDFSAYSDMAIGISRLFGIKLPLNFHSPYKSINIIEFWRRWHMTLCRFLRDYLYIPLGGNRKGKSRRHINLMITMLLGGLWHGAGWNYVVWGGLHGCYLMVNHFWQEFCYGSSHSMRKPSIIGRVLSTLLTFIAVVVAWVFFRADNIESAQEILKAMGGVNGLVLPAYWRAELGGITQWLVQQGVVFNNDVLLDNKEMFLILIGLLIVWFTPNTQEIMARYKPAISDPSFTEYKRTIWRPTILAALVVWMVGFVAIIKINEHSVFLYFQF